MDIRKRVLRDYNKKEEDFATLREYNDYLEEIETIVYNLTNNIDIVATNKRIEQYKRDNREIILKNKSKISREELELEHLLELEQQQEELYRQKLKLEENEIKKKKIREKEALIDELTYSDGNAKNIIDTFALNVQEQAKVDQVPAVPKQFSTGIKITNHSGFLPIPKIEEGPQFVYSAPQFKSNGPPAPTYEQLHSQGFIHHMRAETLQERAGGYKSEIACKRALQDALTGLYHVPKPVV